MNKPDGGPAFPFERIVQTINEGLMPARERQIFFGMSLRDWFAGQALAAALPNAKIVDGASMSVWGPEEHAANAYRLADAMIAEREK
jgi:hypothetical protein